ncbi:MAG: glycerol permease, partial [Methanocorpusculum sp.]|nr:glycerol permease [Methanocorpusculum sp.]
MADFIETSKSRNAKRTYDKIADADTFESVVAAFKADSTMGLTRKEAGAETYKTRIDYFDVAG